MPFPLFVIFLATENEDDRRFLESLYMDYHRLMYAQALQILRGAEAAQDAVSDAIIALSKKISLLRAFPCNKLKAYLVTTVRHCAINQFNRRQRERIDGSVAMEDLAGSGRVEDGLLERAGVRRIAEAIRRLPEREKEIMLMKYFRELTDAEIAAETGLREVSVRVHLSRARKHLAGMLKNEGADE